MKKIILTAITATIAIAFVAGPASASTDSSNGQTARLTGNAAAVYNDPVFGPTRCNETQHRKFDTVSCTLDTPNLALAGTTATVAWFSDFDGTFGSFTYTFSADGSNYSGKATY